MNIIIVGLGKIGEKLVELISSEGNHNITVIDKNHSILQDVVNAYDVLGVEGNCASIDTLKEAGIEQANILISVTDSDEINLLTCLIARKLSHCDTIARVRNPEYRKEVNLFKEDLGLAMIINPEFTSARAIARALRFPSAIEIDTFAKGRVEIFKLKIQEESPLNDLKIMDLSSKFDCDILICGVEREEEAIIPRGDFLLKTGDFISVVATLKNASEFIKKIGFKATRVKDTTIVGGGTTAVYLADTLMKSGINVKIIEKDKARCEFLCSVIPKATIINGDGTETDLLIEEGIEGAESVVALTGIDEENILLSLYAKTQTTGKIITKINRISYDEVISHLGLDTIIYPKDIVAEDILKFIRAKNNSLDSDIETIHYILDGKAEALEFRIKENSPVSNKAIENIALKEGIIIASINRNGNIIIPKGKDVILPKDTVVVVTAKKGFKDISDILK